ncbi:sulfotransferase 1A1 isoform X3 [Procambarus clarkii]
MNTTLASGHEVEAMSEEWLARMEQEQTLYNQGMVRLRPGGWLYPTVFTKYADAIYNYKFTDGDVLVMGMPRSGTTWMLELVWTMLHNPDLNQRGNLPIFIRAPHIDFDMMLDSKTIRSTVENPQQFTKMFRQMCPGKKVEDGVFLQISEALPAPRVMKTHLPSTLLPPSLLQTTKVVYMARDPKDVVVSLFHHFCNVRFHNYTGTFDNFVKHFINNDLLYSPYWPNLMMAWEQKDDANMHFVFYEDLKADIKKELGTLNEFLGTNLSQQQLENVAQHTSFSSMKARSEKDAANYHQGAQRREGAFFRKGEIGDWKNHFSPELEQDMNRWIEKNLGNIIFRGNSSLSAHGTKTLV